MEERWQASKDLNEDSNQSRLTFTFAPGSLSIVVVSEASQELIRLLKHECIIHN